MIDKRVAEDHLVVADPTVTEGQDLARDQMEPDDQKVTKDLLADGIQIVLQEIEVKIEAKEGTSTENPETSSVQTTRSLKVKSAMIGVVKIKVQENLLKNAQMMIVQLKEEVKADLQKGNV